MASVMVATITFDDASALTTTEAHELTALLATFLTTFIRNQTSVTAVTVDFAAADTLTAVVT